MELEPVEKTGDILAEDRKNDKPISPVEELQNEFNYYYPDELTEYRTSGKKHPKKRSKGVDITKGKGFSF